MWSPDNAISLRIAEYDDVLYFVETPIFQLEMEEAGKWLKWGAFFPLDGECIKALTLKDTTTDPRVVLTKRINYLIPYDEDIEYLKGNKPRGLSMLSRGYYENNVTHHN